MSITEQFMASQGRLKTPTNTWEQEHQLSYCLTDFYRLMDLHDDIFCKEVLLCQNTEQFVASQGRHSGHQQLHDIKNSMLSNQLSVYLTDSYRLFDLYGDIFCVDVLFWQTTEQSMAPQGRDTEHQHLHDNKNKMFSNPLSLSLYL